MRRLWIVSFIIILSSFCFAQRSYELPCPIGSSDMEGPTYNPITNKYRSWLCVDSFGNVSSPAFGTSGTGLAATGPSYFVLSQSCSSGSTNCFNSPLNTQQVTDCSWSNTSQTVSCTGNHFVPTDVGKRIYGFSTCKTNQANYTNSLGATATTITSVNAANNITISLATTGAQTSPSCLIFGNPDDTATALMDTAVQGSSSCPVVNLPASGILWALPHFTTAIPSCQLTPAFSGQSDYVFGLTLQGQGQGNTIVYLTPDFPFSSPPCTSPGLGCFGISGTVFQYFTMTGGGLTLPVNGPTFSLFSGATGLNGFGQLYFNNFACTNIGLADKNSLLFSTPNTGQGINNIVIRTAYSLFDGCAGLVQVGDGTHYEVLDSLETAYEDMGGFQCSLCSGNTTTFVITAGAEFSSNGGNLFAPGPILTSGSSVLFLNSGGTVRFTNRDVLSSSNGSNGILVTYGTSGTGPITYASRTQFGQTGVVSGNAGNTAYAVTATNDQSYIRDSQFNGGATTGNAITVGGTGAQFHDLGGNSFASGNAGRIGITNGMYLNGATEIYNQTSTTQTGSIAATTMTTPANNTNARVFFRLTQIAAGTGCTTNTTISPSIIFTDPLAAGSTTAAVCTFTITNNGTANVPIIPPTSCSEVFAAKSTTAIQFSTTFTGGTCTTTPTYQVTPTLNLE